MPGGHRPGRLSVPGRLRRAAGDVRRVDTGAAQQPIERQTRVPEPLFAIDAAGAVRPASVLECQWEKVS